MRVTWSLPIPGEPLSSSRGDLVRARSLIAALREAGHDIVVVSASARPTTAAAVSAYRRVVRRFLPWGSHALRDAARIAVARAHAGRVAAAARAQGAELIIETQVHPMGSGARAARLAGVPLLLDDCSPATEEAVLGAGLPRLAGAVFRHQARAAAVLVVSSAALRDLLVAEGVGPEKVSIVPNGVDTALFERVDRAAARRRFGVVGHQVLGYVGSFQPWHQVELLVQALSLLPNPAAIRLLLIGDGPGRAAALSAAETLGLKDRVLAPGPLGLPEVAAALAACDIGVLPATNAYGQPMKLLEYAAAALPAVAPDLPPVREVLEPDSTGLLFPPGDVAALAAALRRLLDDAALRRRLGACARARVGAEVSWGARARALVELAPQRLAAAAAAP